MVKMRAAGFERECLCKFECELFLEIIVLLLEIPSKSKFYPLVLVCISSFAFGKFRLKISAKINI